MSDCILVLCNCPDEINAMLIAETLVAEHLVACVNRVPGIASTYRWKGQLQHDTEHLLLIKTTRERFDAVRERILALHQYELPEILAVDIASGYAPYLDWIASQSAS
jgi:periplasmic divalent cation tolerance protein